MLFKDHDMRSVLKEPVSELEGEIRVLWQKNQKRRSYVDN
jgi:hypothetical protein